MTRLGECYKQLNSSVGKFGAYTLTASTSAIESNTPSDAEFTHVDAALSRLDKVRDSLAITIKDELYAAENWGVPVHNPDQQIFQCDGIIAAAKALASSTSSS